MTELADVTDTAFWVAVYRAEETAKKNSLFKDPFASLLAGEHGKEIEKAMSASKYTRWVVVIRTCIIDAYIKDLIDKGIDTVINLGAGLDTRPYRMDLPSRLQWIEVDHPRIIDLKESKLAQETPKCKLVRIKLDLSQDVERKKCLAQLAEKSKKALILTEGVIPYLSEEQVAKLANDLRGHKSFCFWILEYFSPTIYKYMKGAKRMRQMRNAPFLFTPPDWYKFFAKLNWQPTQERYLGEEAIKLGRPFPLPLIFRILRIFFSSKNMSAYNRFTGFFVLEPK